MTTKKSKPASLTSSLLARKGEAEPATAPYSIPEAGRQRASDGTPAKGNGNGAGGDLGHALSGLTASGEKAARPEINENGMHSQSVRPAEPRQPELPEDEPETTEPEMILSAAEIRAVEPEPIEEEPTAEEIFIESAVAEEVSLDEAVIEAAVHDTAAVASSGRADTPAGVVGTGGESPVGAGAGSSGDDTGGPEKTEIDREAARDARLLRFVYAMAALTGIVAIVLYAGGWLRDMPKQRVAEAPATTASAPASSGSATGSETPAPKAENSTASSESGSASAIPAAPPVAPVDEKPAAMESGVTTGGPAKSTADTPPAESTRPAVAATPAMPPAGSSEQMPKAESGATASSTGTLRAPAASETAAAGKSGTAPAASESAGKTETPASASGESRTAAAEATPVVPTPAAPEPASKAPVVTEPVREVPNMRVLAPAIGRPKPAETAPSTETPTTPKVSAEVPKIAAPPRPSETQTAAVPKAAARKPSASNGGDYRVQLSSVSSDAVAKREWARLQKAYPDIFGDKTLVVEKKEIAGRGTFYRVQAGGYASLDEARSVCTELKARKQGCLPVKR